MGKRTENHKAPKITNALLDKLSDGILLVDKNDQIIFANRSAITLTGKQELIGHHLTPLLKLPNSNGSIPTNPVLFHLPSTSTDVLATFFDAQTFPGIQELTRNATHLVILQVPSRNETSPASAYQLILGNLTLRIAHDFNNDLTSVLGDAEYIRGDSGIHNSRAQQYITSHPRHNPPLPRECPNHQTASGIRSTATPRPRHSRSQRKYKFCSPVRPPNTWPKSYTRLLSIREFTAVIRRPRPAPPSLHKHPYSIKRHDDYRRTSYDHNQDCLH